MASLTLDSLRSEAHDYYEWNLREYPVGASESGRHTWDDRLTDYSPAAIQRRAAHVRDLLARVHATDITNWSKDDKIDCDPFPRAARSTRLREPRSQAGRVESAGLRRRSQQRDLLAAEEGVRHAAQTRALRNGASAESAGDDRAGKAQPHASDRPLRAVGGGIGAQHRSAVQRQPDDAGQRHDAGGARCADRREGRRLASAARLRRLAREAPARDDGLEAAGPRKLRVHAAPHPSSSVQRARCRAPRRSGAGAISRARGDASRSIAGRSESAAREKHPRGSAGVPRRVSEPRAGDDRLSQRETAGHDSRLHRTVHHSPAPGSVQADQSRRLHESARHLRSRQQRLLLHPDVQPAEPQLLHPRRDRRSASDPRTRRDPRTLPADLHRQSSARTRSAVITATRSSPKGGRCTARRC